MGYKIKLNDEGRLILASIIKNALPTIWNSSSIRIEDKEKAEKLAQEFIHCLRDTSEYIIITG